MSLSCSQRIAITLFFLVGLASLHWFTCFYFSNRQEIVESSQNIPFALSTNDLFMASCALFKTSSVPQERYSAALICAISLKTFLRTNKQPLMFEHVVGLLGPPNLPSESSELWYIIYFENVPYVLRIIGRRPGKIDDVIFNTGVDI